MCVGNQRRNPFDYQFLDEAITFEYCADLPDSLDRPGRAHDLPVSCYPLDTQQTFCPSASEDFFEQIMMIWRGYCRVGPDHTPTIVNINDGACYVFSTLCEMCAY